MNVMKFISFVCDLRLVKWAMCNFLNALRPTEKGKFSLEMENRHEATHYSLAST